MADIFKQFVRHLDGVNRAAVADAAGKAIAEHCDERIAKAIKAIKREQKTLRKLARTRNPTVSEVDQSFQRLLAAVGPLPSQAKP